MMRFLHRVCYTFPLFLFVCPGVVSPAFGQSSRAAAERAVRQLEAASGKKVSASFSPATDVVTFLSLDPEAPLTLSLPAGTTAEDRARAFLGGFGAAFGIQAGDGIVLERSSRVDHLGMEHVRFQQAYRGVPITGAELSVHLRGSSVTAVNAKTIPDVEGLETTPEISPAEATRMAASELQRALGITDATLSEPRLELLNQGLLEGWKTETRLAWFIEATKVDLREFIWIDAEHATLLLRFSQLTDNRVRLVFDANDPGDGVYDDLPGDLARLEGEGATGDADTDAAYDFSGDTYDYFWNEHGRDSYNDAGIWMVSSVHYCPEVDPPPDSGDCPYANAYWNGTQTVFGEGLSQADDIVAHEWTHAVTEHTANLFYYMQSGALNESYSDIFGEIVDLTNGTGDDSAGVRWQAGEDIGGSASVQFPVPVRDMMDPTLYGDPGKMSDSEFDCRDHWFFDRGGVHTNSGVPNHAFALMVDGGTYNGQSVFLPIGLPTAARIQYRALSYYLTSASSFRDNYDALNQACQDLSGAPGFPLLGCVMVKRALDAVEMGAGWPCSSPIPRVEPPPLCSGEQAPSIWHYWDIETSGVTACPTDAWPTSLAWCLNSSSSVLGAHATSGEKSYWGFNFDEVSNYPVTVTTSGTLPPGARMQFNHSFGFSNSGSSYDDGGQVELLDSPTLTYFDGGPLITAGQPYGGVISASSDNPIGGESAFVGDSRGYTASQLNLSSLAGQSLKYRFRVATDTGGWDIGWFIDDVRIYTCALCLQNRTLSAGNSGVADAYRASVSIHTADGFTVGGAEDLLLSAPQVRIGNGFEAHGQMTVDNTGCIYIPPG